MVTIAVSVPRQTAIAKCPVCKGLNEPWDRVSECDHCEGTGIAPLPRAATARGDEDGGEDTF